MYTANASAPPFKDNRLRSQVPTCASTLVCTSDQFHSSWRPSPNHTRGCGRVRHSSGRAPGRRTPPPQAPNRKPSLLSKLILVPATSSGLSIAFFTARVSNRWDTKTVISSAYAGTFSLTQPAKETPHRDGLALSLLSLRSRSSKARTWRSNPCRTDRSIANAFERFFVHLHHCPRVVVQHADSPAELLFESGSHQKPMVHHVEGFGPI